MEKKSIYGLTKGTGLEKLIEAAAMGKAMGVMNHYSLALMAEEQGLPKELAERLRELADQESVHAGYYATLNAKYPSDVFQMMETCRRASWEQESSYNLWPTSCVSWGEMTSPNRLKSIYGRRFIMVKCWANC